MTFSCNEQAFSERFFWRQNNWYSIGKDASAFTPIRELAGHEAAVVGTPFRQMVSGEGASIMPAEEAFASVRKRSPMSVFAFVRNGSDHRVVGKNVSSESAVGSKRSQESRFAVTS